MSGLFEDLSNFNEDISTWNVAGVMDMSQMFKGARSFDQPIGSWQTSSVTTMAHMFDGAAAFNHEIFSWDVSNVQTMSHMFHGAVAFNQPLESWDTSRVSDMTALFSNAESFNQPVGSWITGAVIRMSGMFQNTGIFNQPLSTWDMSAVSDVSSMFQNAASFNHPVGAWDTAVVTNMRGMFSGAAVFDQPIGMWDTSSVKDMSFMFSEATSFNQPIENWTTVYVTNMTGMFFGASVFNSSLQLWNTSSVRSMAHMFQEASAFNQPIGSWDTSSVADMSYMFDGAVAFNQPIFTWNVSAVLDTTLMFSDAVSFNQPLRSWRLPVPASHDMFRGADAFKRPPCPGGFSPAINGLGCEPCPVGQFALPGGRCETCQQGFVPTSDSEGCQKCADGSISVFGVCEECVFPFVIVNDVCELWPLPTVFAAAALALLALWVCISNYKARTEAEIKHALDVAYRDLWDEHPEIEKHAAILQFLGMKRMQVQQKLAEMQAQQSLLAGVGLHYLLSEDFASVARERTKKQDPSFNDMKDAFWMCDEPLGHDVRCPRDGRMGCALVDWIPRSGRQEQSHFMSWTWRYRLSEVQSALQIFQRNVEESRVFFYMCFFVNNQFRIILESTGMDAEDLQAVFESNLKRIGRVVAILDTWDKPMYLTRIWTVYEQFMATKLEVPVTFVMPDTAMHSAQEQMLQGEVGMRRITEALCNADSENAEAWLKEDEIKVKGLIRNSVGFEHVNTHVTQVMVQWQNQVDTIGDLLCQANYKDHAANCGGTVGLLQTPWGNSEVGMTRGIKQGAVESPVFFGYIAELVLSDAAGVHGWRSMTPLYEDLAPEEMLYMDDGMLWNGKLSVIQTRAQQLSTEFARYGLKMNPRKCQLYASPKVEGEHYIVLDGTRVEASPTLEVMGLSLRVGVSLCELITPALTRARFSKAQDESWDSGKGLFGGRDRLFMQLALSVRARYGSDSRDLLDYATRDSGRETTNLGELRSSASSSQVGVRAQEPVEQPGWLQTALSQLGDIRQGGGGLEPLWLAVLRRVEQRGNDHYARWSRLYLRPIRAEFSNRLQWERYTSSLTEGEIEWASRVELATFQDYNSAAGTRVQQGEGGISRLPTHDQVLADMMTPVDANYPFGLMHAGWVNSATGQWGPRGTEDPASVLEERAEDGEETVLFQTGTWRERRWEDLLEQFQQWFEEGREVGIAVRMVHTLTHSRGNPRYARWASRPIYSLGVGYPNSQWGETSTTPPDFFDWANEIETLLYDGCNREWREMGLPADDQGDTTSLMHRRPTEEFMPPRPRRARPYPRTNTTAEESAGTPDAHNIVIEERSMFGDVLFDPSRFGPELQGNSVVPDHFLPEATLRRIRTVHQQMSHHNRMLSTIALVTMMRYLMCDLSQTVELADGTVRIRDGDRAGAEPEPDEELLMQQFMVSRGKDTADRRWTRAMIRLQKELMGQQKAARLTHARLLRMGLPSGDLHWGSQLEALLIATLEEDEQVEGSAQTDPEWLSSWVRELGDFIPGFQQVTEPVEIESQDRGQGQNTEKGAPDSTFGEDITDREIEQLARDPDEERDRQQQLKAEEAMEQKRVEEHEALCEQELAYLRSEAEEYHRWEGQQLRSALRGDSSPPGKRRCMISIEAASSSGDRPRIHHTLALAVPENGSDLVITVRANMQPIPEEVPTEVIPVPDGKEELDVGNQMLQEIYRLWEAGSLSLVEIRRRFGNEVVEMLQAQKAVSEEADLSLLREQAQQEARDTMLDAASPGPEAPPPVSIDHGHTELGRVGSPKVSFAFFENIYGQWKDGLWTNAAIQARYGEDWVRLFQQWKIWGLEGIWHLLGLVLDMSQNAEPSEQNLIVDTDQLRPPLRVPFVVVQAYYRQWLQGFLTDSALQANYGAHWLGIFGTWQREGFQQVANELNMYVEWNALGLGPSEPDAADYRRGSDGGEGM
ncbi:unnamed protein product [Symbiodinium necroappetens]|uniref:Uncharacterized protein n=1 Tax=Symbiodinium necroappetens TaxID=1628268 RepID=A0A812SCK3_9DINO|nr:unnamed protein product [Symbiodinium necroappetens]